MPFEQTFDYNKTTGWMYENMHLPYIVIFVFYLPFVYFGSKIMENRQAFKLKTCMLIWNCFLAVFSTISAIRIVPEFIQTCQNQGFKHSICNHSYKYHKPCAFWMFLFCIFKIPELVDTLFLVLRKQNLIFLHVYHHATVVIYSWHVYHTSLGNSRWFASMNSTVHSIMYTYYALKGLPSLIKIPKWCSMILTGSQTLQMVVGSYVVVVALYEQLIVGNCHSTTPMATFGFVIYFSYLVLFSQFFYSAYLSKTKREENIVTDQLMSKKQK